MSPQGGSANVSTTAAITICPPRRRFERWSGGDRRGAERSEAANAAEAQPMTPRLQSGWFTNELRHL